MNAELVLCTEGAPAAGNTVNIEAKPENPLLIDEKWKCEIGNGKFGEWEQVD